MNTSSARFNQQLASIHPSKISSDAMRGVRFGPIPYSHGDAQHGYLGDVVALNRESEFRMHIQAAIRNGVTKDEIRAVLMMTAIYCGLPAANNAIHWAEDVSGETEASEIR